jgi:hypothetical protein
VNEVISERTACFPAESVREYCSRYDVPDKSQTIFVGYRMSEQDGPTSDSRDCVVVRGRWALRVEIDDRVLNGDRVPLPRGFGHALGVPRNTSKRVGTVGGHRLGVSRKPKSESLGQLRSVVEWLGLESGDILFIISPSHPADEVEFRTVPAAEIAEMNEERRVAALLGIIGALDPEGAAEALGLSASSSPATVVAVLRRRGEAELADALAAVLESMWGKHAGVQSQPKLGTRPTNPV